MSNGLIAGCVVVAILCAGGLWAWQIWRDAKLVAKTIDRLAPALLEPDAFCELVRLSRRRSHFLERHGPMLKIDEIWERVQSGNLPAAGFSGKPVASGRWVRHQDLLLAVNSAREHWMNGARPVNGVFRFKFDREIGQGYLRGSQSPVQTDCAIVVIKGETVVTAYPVVDGLKTSGWHNDE
ncbi:MAG: hypothetical protein GY952_17540, partial [Rhodobacteraceae bacterium]|nr:hypothetical protein [Paracoccaceae bacterium]